MRISDILGMSLSNLWKRKMRTVLTVLGVVIGTASIVVMLSLGLGLKEAMMAQVGSASGLTEISVESDAMYGGSDSLLLDDSTIAMFSDMEYVENVEPQIYYSMPFQIGNYEGYMELIGASQDYLSKIELGDGTYPDSNGNMGIIVGNQMVMNLMDMTTGEWVDFESEEVPNVDFMNTPMIGGIEEGDSYDIEGMGDDAFDDFSDDLGDANSDFAVEEDFSVDDIEDTDSMDDFEDDSVGEDFAEDEYLEEDSEVYSYFTPDMKRMKLNVCGVTAGDLDTYTDYSYYCYTDIDALKAFLKKNYSANSVIPGQPTDKEGKPYRDLKYSQLVVKVDEADNVETVLEDIQSMGYMAYASKEWLDEIEKEFMIIEAVLGGIGAVAMLVAAISIANTMTMSIYERTKEIGVMKVLGCGLSNIRSMFLTEAAFIGFIGGIVGLLLSYFISFLLNQFLAPIFMADMYGVAMNISAIPLWLTIVAVVFSTIVGMVAGFFPAQRATRLSPLAAIRNE
ncbi:MAG: ABC transporter permease [Lachnospiraceae bacterium]|nr:ABC transporter permease [Lachnospiraceae bacterium]